MSKEVAIQCPDCEKKFSVPMLKIGESTACVCGTVFVMEAIRQDGKTIRWAIFTGEPIAGEPEIIEAL